VACLAWGRIGAYQPHGQRVEEAPGVGLPRVTSLSDLVVDPWSRLPPSPVLVHGLVVRLRRTHAPDVRDALGLLPVHRACRSGFEPEDPLSTRSCVEPCATPECTALVGCVRHGRGA